MSSNDLGASSLRQPSFSNDGQYDPSRHIDDDGFCCYEISRTPSDASDSSDPQAIGDSPSPSQNFEEATRVRHALHQAYPDLFQRRLAILKELRHESIPTFR